MQKAHRGYFKKCGKKERAESKNNTVIGKAPGSRGRGGCHNKNMNGISRFGSEEGG